MSLQNGLVDHIGPHHERTIVRSWQHAVINCAQPRPATLPKMKIPDRLIRCLRQQLQQLEVLEQLLAIGLKNFTSQTLRGPRRLLQDDMGNSHARQSQPQNGSASTGSDNDHIRFEIHAFFVANDQVLLKINDSAPMIARLKEQAGECWPTNIYSEKIA